MKRQLILCALAVVLAIQGCASTGNASGKRDLSQTMYLRGQFAWWDALDEYKVKQVAPDVYRSDVALKADGNAYEFKFGDAMWSAGTNCGYQSQEDKVVEFGKKSKANCSSVFENFQFTPKEDGTFAFFLDNSGPVPLVYVEKAN